MNNDNFDWEDVETKISIICRKFNNIPDRYMDDLRQTLRIHAYYYSTDYYDLTRKAIDFWRQLQTREAPEVPYFDLEIFESRINSEKDSYLYYDELLESIKSKLDRPAKNKWDENMIELTTYLLSIICEDIDSRIPNSELHELQKSKLNHYINSRLNLSWIAEERDIGYKRLVKSMKYLEEIVKELVAEKMIDIPSIYLED